MRKHLKKYLIPHHENEHRPHILRETAVTILALFALAAFVFSSIHTAILIGNTDFLAAVLPKVLVDLTNSDRNENNLLSLTTSPVLEAAAQLKADDMAEKEYFAHVSPEGVTPWHWFIEAGYTFVSAGENLAVNFSDSEIVEQAWMDSIGHRANILNGDFTEIGIATSRGQYKGEETVFVVQLFGRPAVANAVSIPDDVIENSVDVVEESIPEVAAETIEVPEMTVEIVEVLPVDLDDGLDEEGNSVVAIEIPTTLEVTRDENMFLAVRDTSVDENSEGFDNQELAGSEAVGLLAPEQASFRQRLFSKPQYLLDIFYLILGFIIFVALVLNIVIQIKHQHPRQIIYGVLLLLLIVALAYIYRNFIFADLFIV